MARQLGRDMRCLLWIRIYANWVNIGSDKGLVAWSAPSHYLNQCWNIVNWTLKNKLQWNFNRNSCLFIQENAFENVVCQNGGHLFQGRWVNIRLCPDQLELYDLFIDQIVLLIEYPQVFSLVGRFLHRKLVPEHRHVLTQASRNKLNIFVKRNRSIKKLPKGCPLPNLSQKQSQLVITWHIWCVISSTITITSRDSKISIAIDEFLKGRRP